MPTSPEPEPTVANLLSDIMRDYVETLDPETKAKRKAFEAKVAPRETDSDTDT